MTTHADYAAKALDLLTTGLCPFVEKQCRSAFGENWLEITRSSFRGDHVEEEIPQDIGQWDAHALLTVMWDQWNAAFRRKLGLFERSLVAELRAFRNRWAHQRTFDFDDTYRLLDSVQRLLVKIPGSSAAEIGVLKYELMQDEFAERVTSAAREAENRIERWIVAFVYLVCGSVFVYLIPKTTESALGEYSWGLSAVVGVGFLYLIYLRIKQRPIQFGPHECRRCARIIYGVKCPYCGPATASMFDSSEFKMHPDSDPAEQPATGDAARPRPR